MVPVLPEALHQKAMSLCHDSPTAARSSGNTDSEDMGKNTAGGILGKHGPRRRQALQGMCHMPEGKTTYAS